MTNYIEYNKIGIKETRRMKRIASFEVDHTTLTPGLYLSRTDGDVTTFKPI